ncbi:hypothetical protein KIN20_008894 [Parelaphostrongylus tenuis]|uniref:Uncharacterized protein n=1 Tax=Parelaphostrongylus tenuis TaxID=148309 RepID=A0AAD5QKV2_PARTN|nr:hypothetical protein KIN20_008894 [Parelaphostrongylus tenuis]
MFCTAAGVSTRREQKEESLNLTRKIAVSNGYETVAHQNRFRKKFKCSSNKSTVNNSWNEHRSIAVHPKFSIGQHLHAWHGMLHCATSFSTKWRSLIVTGPLCSCPMDITLEPFGNVTDFSTGPTFALLEKENEQLKKNGKGFIEGAAVEVHHQNGSSLDEMETEEIHAVAYITSDDQSFRYRSVQTNMI